MARRIRPATPGDAAAIREIYAPFVDSTPIAFEVEIPPVAEMADRIESELAEYPWLVCEADGRVVGYTAAGALRSTPPYRWTAELSVYVAEGHRRSGIGTALYTALLAALDEQGYCNAYAVTTLPNPASQRLHERLDFDPVGTFPALGYKLGEWHNVQWWYRGVGDRPDDPDPPTPFPDLGGKRLDAALRAGEKRLDG